MQLIVDINDVNARFYVCAKAVESKLGVEI